MFLFCIRVELNLEGRGKGMWWSQGWALSSQERGWNSSLSSWELLPCCFWSRWCFVCLFFSQLALPWRTAKTISLISSLLLSLKTSYTLFHYLIVVLCPYFIMGWWRLPGLSWPFCPLCCPTGRSFLPRALAAAGASQPHSSWGCSALLDSWCSGIVLDVHMYYVLAAHALLGFSDLQVVTARDFGDIAPISKQFSVQSSFILWLFEGKTSAPGAEPAGGLVLPSLWWGIASEPHWWELEILGDWEVVPKKKETRLWTYCCVLVIIRILFLEPG